MLRDIVGRSSRQGFQQDSNGILLFYDESRSKHLSASREMLTFGINHKSISDTRWMMVVSKIPSAVTGYRLVRNATITSITIQSQNPITDCTFYIVKNDNASTVTSAQITSASYKNIDNLNIDVNADDWLQAYITPTSGNVDLPVLVLEFAWR